MSEYPFVDGDLYRFHTKGQQKSVAITSGKNVHVVPNNNISEKQIWTVKRNDDANEIRFLNLGTNTYLERDEGDDKLKAESTKPVTLQNFRASTFKTGWTFKLLVGKVWKPVGVKSDGADEWLSLVPEPSTIFDIEHIES